MHNQPVKVTNSVGVRSQRQREVDLPEVFTQFVNAFDSLPAIPRERGPTVGAGRFREATLLKQPFTEVVALS